MVPLPLNSVLLDGQQKVDRAPVDAWMKELSNWGRWGRRPAARGGAGEGRRVDLAFAPGRPAEAAAARKRWEFLLTAASLAVPLGTGSPLNPIATF